MRTPVLLLALAGPVVACTATPGTNPAATPPAGMSHLPSFANEQAFERLLATWGKRVQEQREREAANAKLLEGVEVSATMSVPTPMADVAASTADESITNVQTAGVDEGGIVKRHGDHLVVLRRGRLFTLRVGDDSLRPIASIDAFAPGSDPGGTWYDEMLVSDDRVVVIGYSYQRGGTELGVFDIDGAGSLRHRGTWTLRSDDYYSARNSASRLIGNTLVFYSPMSINPGALEQRTFLPGMRRWNTGNTPPAFKRILPATRIYRASDALDPLDGEVALHTVTRCDLAKPELDCQSSAVLGPAGRVFYVSADSVFVWTTAAGTADRQNPSSVFRIPLDGTEPTGLRTRGVPIDQLSFLQDSEGQLNVLLSANGVGEGMWGERDSNGDIALLRVGLDSFGDGSGAAPASAYRPLPGAAAGDMQNRYIGHWLLYGNAPYRWTNAAETGGKPNTVAYALRYASDAPAQALTLNHGTERIEAMGDDALLVGSAGDDLHFSSVGLDASNARVAGTYVQKQAAQGETRSHGFFYRARGKQDGVAGLPIVFERREDGMQRYLDQSAAVLYLRNRALALQPAGQLDARPENAVDDGCKASCVDWYGNARPIFIGDRVFALLGYELVEGQWRGDRIVERRRVDFAPKAVAVNNGG